MKKTILLFSAVVLFAGLTFGQTPQAQDKSKTTTTTKTEVAAPAKDKKDGCDEKTKANCAHSKDAKGCCAHDKKGDTKKECKDSKAPEKK